MPDTSIITILLFFVYTYGFGFTLTSFLKSSENFFERNLIRIGIGLAALPFLGIIISYFGMPLDWKIFLALSMIYPAYQLSKTLKSKIQTPQSTNQPPDSQIQNPKSKIQLSGYSLIILLMLLIFAFNFYMYHKGAFAYPYLEDDDPWSHAIGAKFVAVEKTVFPSKEEASALQYIHPYPPSYDLLFGILHQTSPSLNWTLKFFNAFIISLSVIFSFFFVKQFTGNKNKALFAAFIIAMIPAYLSHFIWAIALTMPLYFVAFYCTEKISEDKKWAMPSALVIASVLTISPTHSTYFGFFFALYFLTKTILEKKFLKHLFFAGISGALLSAIFWWLRMLFTYGFKELLIALDIGSVSNILAMGGTGDRIYTLKDFLFASPNNMINSPIGIGIIVSILTLIAIGIIALNLKKILSKEHWLVITLVWFFFTLYAVNGARFPIKFSAFRVWPLFAIPVSILAAEGLHYLLLIIKSFNIQDKNIEKALKIILILIIAFGIWQTSGKQKFALNTTQWGPGQGWVTYDETGAPKISSDFQAYLSLTNLPKNTKVFSFINDGGITGYDKFTCAWCPEIKGIQKNHKQKTAEEIYSVLKNMNYEYLIIGQLEIDVFGANETSQLKQKLEQSQKFVPAGVLENTIVYRII